MLILAVDSTASTASVALAQDELCVFDFNRNTTLTHSETLLPMIDDGFRKCGIGVDKADMFAVAVGPGSFTGVRIGVSLIKGLAFGSGKPCVGVSTLEALAYNLTGLGGLICPVMDARRGQVYNALFRDGTRLTEDRLITLDELGEELSRYDEKIYFCGDGYALARKAIELPNINDTPMRLVPQSAYSVSQIALANYRKAEDKGVFTDSALLPKYLRASQAERELNKRNN